jgi:hypothetical protein
LDTTPHPAAPHHLPFFLPGPDGADPVFLVTGILLALAMLAFGLLFLRLHTLPERMAHRGHKLQFEIVAVLGLLALFTHMHIFWVLGLLLALIDLPDFTGPLRRIAGSAEAVAGLEPGAGDTISQVDAAGQSTGHGALKEQAERSATDIASPQRAAEIARARHEA